MRRTDSAAKRRPLSELNVIDDFLFTELMNDPEHSQEFSELLISTLIGRKISVRRVQAQMTTNATDTDEHGIRMDAYIEPLPNGEENAVIYDMEMETRAADKESLPRRNRYYSSLLDSHLLKIGKDYKTLPELMTIFVLSYDPFAEGRMLYEARTSIVGAPEIPYDDGIRRLYFYTDGEPPKDSGEYGNALKNLLQYIRHSTDTYVVDETTKRIDSFVNDAKIRKGVAVRHMKRWELDKIIRKEGQDEILALHRWLLDNNRMEDLRRSTDDNEYREQLFAEMNAGATPSE